MTNITLDTYYCLKLAPWNNFPVDIRTYNESQLLFLPFSISLPFYSVILLPSLWSPLFGLFCDLISFSLPLLLLPKPLSSFFWLYIIISFPMNPWWCNFCSIRLAMLWSPLLLPKRLFSFFLLYVISSFPMKPWWCDFSSIRLAMLWPCTGGTWFCCREKSRV